MENRIDQFFKDKIENHSLAPSEKAWAKVEANLSKKNNVIAWRIAAAVLIAGALISLLVWSWQDETVKPIATTTPTPKNPTKEKSQPAFAKPKTKIIEQRHERVQKEKLADNSLPKENTEKKLPTKELLPANKSVVKEETVAVVQKASNEENKIAEATQPVVIASTKQKAIKLEFTLDEISSEPVATANETKSTGLKKVWELAREVKNGDGPMREMKNELFAFNFKKNKNQ